MKAACQRHVNKQTDLVTHNISILIPFLNLLNGINGFIMVGK